MASKYIPQLMIDGKEWSPVRGCIARPPGTHPQSPIRNDLHAVEIMLANGAVRWLGGTYAYIDSSLRMVIEGYNGAESASWEEV